MEHKSIRIQGRICMLARLGTPIQKRVRLLKQTSVFQSAAELATGPSTLPKSAAVASSAPKVLQGQDVFPGVTVNPWHLLPPPSLISRRSLPPRLLVRRSRGCRLGGLKFAGASTSWLNHMLPLRPRLITTPRVWCATICIATTARGPGAIVGASVAAAATAWKLAGERGMIFP
jgi:hypothetical protein